MMTIQQAIDDALCAERPEHVAPAAAARSSVGRADPLTPREREVAILVGRGYTNRRIAEALVVTERTAEVHARNIREKLGLATRAQIASWAAQQGLLSADA